jgi:nicotinate phosphoribosyltransferase
VANAVAAAGATLGAVRIDSGELGVLARQVREQLDQLGATRTRIVVSGDLDEFSIAALRAEPVDSYGVGTSLVTGSGAPTANMVYKLVEVDGMPVQKRSSHKESHGGHKEALRLSRPTGTITEEIVYPAGHRRTVPGVDHPAGPWWAGGSRHGQRSSGRCPGAGCVRAAQPPVGGSEIGARRPGDPDGADPGLIT